MDLKFEDIIKNIFPGLLLFVGGYFYCTGIVPFYNGQNPFPLVWKDFGEIIFTGLLVLAYFLGYINDMIASWLEEGPLFWIFKRPTYNLFKERAKRIKLYDNNEIFNKLKELSPAVNSVKANLITEKDAKIIFQKAKTITETNASDLTKNKYEAFYKSYNFARNILTAILILGIIIYLKRNSLDENFYSWLFVVFYFILVFLLIVRWIERGLYYSRLVLTTAYSFTENSTDDINAKAAAINAKAEADKAIAASLMAEAAAKKLTQSVTQLQSIVDFIKTKE